MPLLLSKQLTSLFEVAKQKPVFPVVDLSDADSSVAETGPALTDVPVFAVVGVEGDAPVTRDSRAPDRGVIFPLSVGVGGDRSSLFAADNGGPVSDRARRRGGLAGEALRGGASLGVKVLFAVLRKLLLRTGVSGLAAAPFLCLSGGMFREDGCG